MIKPCLILFVLTLAGCTSPALTANVGIGAGGVTVRPALSTNLGGANISVSP